MAQPGFEIVSIGSYLTMVVLHRGFVENPAKALAAALLEIQENNLIGDITLILGGGGNENKSSYACGAIVKVAPKK